LAREKSVVYECDNPSCQKKFLNAEEVFEVDTITDGNSSELVGNSMLCPTCLLKFLFIDRDILDPITDAFELIEEKMAEKEEELEEDFDYQFGDDEEYDD
jgi:hypothetical protein